MLRAYWKLSIFAGFLPATGPLFRSISRNNCAAFLASNTWLSSKRSLLRSWVFTCWCPYVANPDSLHHACLGNRSFFVHLGPTSIKLSLTIIFLYRSFDHRHRGSKQPPTPLLPSSALPASRRHSRGSAFLFKFHWISTQHSPAWRRLLHTVAGAISPSWHLSRLRSPTTIAVDEYQFARVGTNPDPLWYASDSRIRSTASSWQASFSLQA